MGIEIRSKGGGERLEELASSCKVILSSEVIIGSSVKAGTSWYFPGEVGPGNHPGEEANHKSLGFINC